MVYVELEQASELQGAGEEEDDPVENAHCRVEETRQPLFSVVRFVPSSHVITHGPTPRPARPHTRDLEDALVHQTDNKVLNCILGWL